MTREISEYAEKEGLFKFHITSLQPLNPNNKPDEFEHEALRSFERGDKERYQTSEANKKTYFRYMAPLHVSGECLQCHEKQGYKIGDIRGGISVSFDIENIVNKLKSNYKFIILFSISMLFSILGLVYFFTGKLINQISKARQLIEKMAVTDALTGIYNRRHLMIRFLEEFKRAKRLKRDLGCIMIDIDHFKNVNDQYGHLTGDEILKKVSVLLGNAIRIYDILGRFGGEEFLIVLPDTDFENIRSLAERIRLNIRENAIENINLTISLGISSLRVEDESIDAMVKRADEGLYKAKYKGRDRVEWIDVQ